MSDIRKFLDIINETSAGATASGSVATVAQPMTTTQKRIKEEDKSKTPEVLEYGNWENSALTTSNELKKSRKRAAKLVKSIYGEDTVEEGQSSEQQAAIAIAKKKKVAEGLYDDDGLSYNERYKLSREIEKSPQEVELIANRLASYVDEMEPEMFTRWGVEFLNDKIQKIARMAIVGRGDSPESLMSKLKSELKKNDEQDVAEGFEPGNREIERWATQSEENQKIYNAYIKAGKMADEAYAQKDGAAYTGLQLRRKQIRDLIANKMSEQGVAEGLVGDVVVHNYTKMPIDLKPGQAQIHGWGPNDQSIYRVKGADGKEVITSNKKKMMMVAHGQGVAEGYILKKTNVEKTFEPGDPDEYYTSGGADVTTKDTDYEIINNKTGKVVGTASWTTNDYFGPGALKITMKNGATRWLDIWEREKGNPQTAFNRFVKDPKTAKKYKDQEVAEGIFKQTTGQKQYGVLHSQLKSLADFGQINTPAGKKKAEKIIDTIQQLVDTDPSCAGSTVPSKKIWLSEQGVAEGLNEFAPGSGGDDSGNNVVSLETVAKIIAMEVGNNVTITKGTNKNQPSFKISLNDQNNNSIKVWTTRHPRTKQVNPTYNTILFIDNHGEHVEKAKSSTYANALSTAKLLKKQQGVAEGRFIKGPGGVPLDRQGNPKLPKTSVTKAPSQPKLTLDAVWRKAEDVVSQIYPDGDPIDHLIPWFKKHGITGLDIGDILERAAKKHGYKDIYDYYDSMKDQHSSDQGVAEATGDSRFDSMMNKISAPAVKQARQKRSNDTIISIADAICNAEKCNYNDLSDEQLEFIAHEADTDLYTVMSALGKQGVVEGKKRIKK